MSNHVYAKGKEYILANGLSGETLKAVFVASGTHADNAADVFLDDLTSPSASATLSGITFTDGELDCATVVFSALTGPEYDRIYVYVDSGSAATSNLISRHDVAVTPNGSDYNIDYSGGGPLYL